MRPTESYRVSSEAEMNHLAGSAAGHALLVVSWPVGVGGTGTLVASSRWEQTQVTAASIVGLTWMTRHWRVEKTCTHGMNMRTHTYMFLHSFRNLLDPKNNNTFCNVSQCEHNELHFYSAFPSAQSALQWFIHSYICMFALTGHHLGMPIYGVNSYIAPGH